MAEALIQLARKNFPKRLLEIPQPPKTLYLMGKMPEEGAKYLCVVGSRKGSAYGQEAAKKLITGLRGQNIVIVSGLAFGIDSVAHKAALSAGLSTIAVPGSGLSNKVLYPASNKGLAESILLSGGALLSEFEPDFRAAAWSFPQRNRIMAGLSDAVLVVEAQRKSGSLITARLALDYNRDLWAVPGPIFSALSEGPNWLLSRGAAAVSTSQDILSLFGLETGNIDSETLFDSATDEEKILLSHLKEPVSKDELVRLSGLSAGELNGLLSVLEIKGFITENAGLVYAKGK